MKKTSFLYLSLAAIVVGSFASCQEEDFGVDEDVVRTAAVARQYVKEFVKEFGEPDPNHTWGFEEIPILDFSVQTRVHDANGHMWAPNYGLDVPYPLTETQKNTVTEWFTTHKNPQGIAVSWTDYFAQQVSSTSYGRHMDQLLDAGHGYTDHINNFNSGDCGGTQQTYPGVSDKIMYMYNQSTQAFGYHESVGQNTYFDHYVIISGEMIDPNDELGAQGQSIHGMFFVGFDYEANKADSDNDDVPRDWFFNDWIIKISPGSYKTGTTAKRVMCEDLGGSFDWDFNDVVFDVAFRCEESYWPVYRKEVYATITIQAAGGTLPITVGTTNPDYEVHKLLGNGEMSPILRPNTVAIYNVPLDINTDINTANPRLIPIYVKGNDITKTAIDINPTSNVPQRFACPVDVDWVTPDTRCITDMYHKFPQWVLNDYNMRQIWTHDPHGHN